GHRPILSHLMTIINSDICVSAAAMLHAPGVGCRREQSEGDDGGNDPAEVGDLPTIPHAGPVQGSCLHRPMNLVGVDGNADELAGGEDRRGQDKRCQYQPAAAVSPPDRCDEKDRRGDDRRRQQNRGENIEPHELDLANLRVDRGVKAPQASLQ
ncbi:MAG: hypothetical protein JWR37_5010, partial [Mycobacterium sp.]|nr:hypothetical protein [Mycobacterium sp.]